MAVPNSFFGNDFDFDSPSSYPPSSPSQDESDDEMFLAQTSSAAFRSSIASVSESTLRSIVVKLADSNPRFQRAIIKELAYANMNSTPTTPTRPRRSRRSKNRRNCKNLSVAASNPFAYKRSTVTVSSDSPPSPDDSVYHPGHLDEEVYEFLSRTADDVTVNVVRTIAMWSCCDEDEWSPGCVSAPSYPLPEGHQPDIINFSHPDVFPDSDLEQRYEDGPPFHQTADRGP